MDKVKVVILGLEDQYPHDDRAMGLPYSTPYGVEVNRCITLFQELHVEVDGCIILFEELHAGVGCNPTPSHGNLQSWTKQGVLLTPIHLHTLPSPFP
eukprot:gene27362-4664_t